jgi:hypothetical protein
VPDGKSSQKQAKTARPSVAAIRSCGYTWYKYNLQNIISLNSGLSSSNPFSQERKLSFL